MKRFVFVIAVLLLAVSLVPVRGGGRRRGGAGRGSAGAETREARVRRKLRSITIPEVKFRQANVRDVIQFLVDASREYDPDEEGVNIILNLNRRHAATTTAANDDLFGAAELEAQPRELNETITFSARHISLMEALDIVCQVGGLKYRVDGNIVMVVPFDEPDEKIIVRTYNVVPTFGDKVKKVQSEMGR